MRNDLLSLCLDRVAPGRQSMEAGQYEVIVTDDGDMATQLAMQQKYPWVKWVQGPRKGPAANRNNGARYAAGKWLLFLDDDCVPDTGLFAGYLSAIAANPEAKVFEGKIYVDTERHSLGITSPVNLSGGYLWACNFLIERRFFETLRGFDEAFPYAAMEDVDLRIRVEHTGNKMIFVQGASVCHPWRKKGGWKKRMEHNVSTFIFLKKHPMERANIHAGYYLKLVVRNFLYETLPGIVKYKGRGLSLALTEHAGFLLMAVKLAFKKQG